MGPQELYYLIASSFAFPVTNYPNDMTRDQMLIAMESNQFSLLSPDSGAGYSGAEMRFLMRSVPEASRTPPFLPLPPLPPPVLSSSYEDSPAQPIPGLAASSFSRPCPSRGPRPLRGSCGSLTPMPSARPPFLGNLPRPGCPSLSSCAHLLPPRLGSQTLPPLAVACNSALPWCAPRSSIPLARMQSSRLPCVLC